MFGVQSSHLITFNFPSEDLSDMRKQMKTMEEKNVTYMQETMNLEEVKTVCVLTSIPTLNEQLQRSTE